MSGLNAVPTEVTPLRRSNQVISQRATNTQPVLQQAVIELAGSNSTGSSNSNSAVSNPNSESPIVEDRRNNTMNDTKRIFVRIGIDFIILCCVGFPILIFFLVGQPYQRGFFCDDESLMHPFHDSTVTNWMLYIIGIALPIFVIIGTELVRAHVKKTDAQPLKVRNVTVPYWVVEAYKSIGMFGFGAACSQLLTDVGKYTIGRLRPHFFAVCIPRMPDNTTCKDEINRHRYIVDFKCISELSSPRMLKEMRLSFPSGHSSFSMYTLVFCAIYLQSRMNWRGSKLLKHFIQYLLILLAWYTCLSRISDYKHHWSDVLAGGVLGSTVAIVVSNYCTDLFDARRKLSPVLPQTRYELNTNHATSNGSQQP
ncbi:putative phosphatidate phosphatase [Wyeomyia smithii]|uniref:putative phosphatidate phosphatase n=1 Tax=Wyeomyia smithii TaxID=174621 RepID=UPI002467F740|nr:putative phosphatidate phosphatase [Wyeomyia smithii]XP_055538695.1 putative phosphatidate phosphatase [Wyeomyia smithii]XP_055538696.1 putative phosphatidate phosphatase [Wyeomyia smithii]XP_055538697.1 putative phosphatidate phosphatase [Wyeomyia smithii]XP_055538698.1 putative phosphatidate phosphatase [Wyeomyia smithii]XP_055538699.1 putative phosphatidate phosphatase [Wyeomyia smithii]XP_055538701.1 putative phosphatidate phosphatase [Wyeomyia smithii]XP_055538702.1 putative phosphat